MKFTFLVASTLILIAGCSKQPEPAVQTAAAPVTKQTPETPTYPADYKIDQPIPQSSIKTELALVGAPVYQAKNDILQFTVQVTNAGKAPLVTAGTAPVVMAINLAGPEGVDKPPGKRLVGRASLPLIVEGTKGEVKASIPAASILGQTLRVELFQEGIGFFGRRYNQPTLDVGAFQRCKGAAATLCDVSGTAVATK